MSRAAKWVGIAAFLIVEALVVFGSYLVAAIRCCGAAGTSWPIGAEEWATLAIFALVMTFPAALIAGGTVMIVHGVERGLAIMRQRMR